MIGNDEQDNDEIVFTVPIPKIFHSFELDAPFAKCSVCGNDLASSGVPYYIEKAFKGDEVVFEYAMCDNCRGEMSGELSMESMMNLGRFFMENVDFVYRIGELLSKFDNSVKPWLEHCAITGKQRSECEEFQICAQCENDQIVVDLAPMMISSEATLRIQELLSKKTREGFDGFIKDTLNPPVDFQDVPMLL